jgi:hypothetical protein
MLQLSPKPDTLEVTVFWVSVSIVCFAVVGLTTYPLIYPMLITAAFAVIVGFWVPSVMSSAYDLWRTLTRHYIRLARLWSIGVCFYVILGITGSTKANLLLQRPPDSFSMWANWKNTEAEIYSKPDDMSKKRAYIRNWLTSFLDWAANPRHVWAYSLLPFVILLRLAEGEQQKQFPTNIYTLY